MLTTEHCEVPPFTMFVSSIESAHMGRRAYCGKASSVPSDIESGSQRRIFAAGLLPITELGLQGEKT